MSMIREKITELLGEVEIFVEELKERVDTTLSSIDSFAPVIVAELEVFQPELESIQADTIGHIENVEADIDELTQGLN